MTSLTDKHFGTIPVFKRLEKGERSQLIHACCKSRSSTDAGPSPAFEGLGEDDLVEGPREERRTALRSSGSC